MRAMNLILLSALAGLWCYYAAEVEDKGIAPLASVRTDAADETSAASLNNKGVELDRSGRPADALAYFERAHSFRPDDSVIAANYERQRALVTRMGWWRVLVIGSLAVAVFIFGGRIWRTTRGAIDRHRLRRLSLHGNRWMRIDRKAKTAELELKFNEPTNGLTRRHKPNVVWTCASQNQHMKSRRSVRVKGRECRVTLDAKRLKQLRRYPGDWRCILRLGKTEVGEASARVI